MTAQGDTRESADPIRIIIVSGQPLIQGELQHFLTLQPGIRVVRTLRCAADLSGVVDGRGSDVLLLDDTASGGGGLAALAALRAARPETPVVILSAQENRVYLLQAFRAGASGCLLSRSGEDYLVQAIRDVHTGRRYLCPATRAVLADTPLPPLPQSKNRVAQQDLPK